jgi:hypothetical protein
MWLFDKYEQLKKGVLRETRKKKKRKRKMKKKRKRKNSAGHEFVKRQSRIKKVDRFSGTHGDPYSHNSRP